MNRFATSKRWETLVSVLVGIVILAIAVGGVANIMLQNRSIDEDYGMRNNVFLLRTNTENIIRKIDTKSLSEKDIFYFYKDPVTKTFLVFTGASAEKYRYINGDGDFVFNTGSYNKPIYSRILFLEKTDTVLGEKHQIIKVGIKELIHK